MIQQRSLLRRLSRALLACREMRTTKKQEAKSRALQKPRVERSHQVHELRSQHQRGTDMASQLGMASRTVEPSLKMTEPPERIRVMLSFGCPKKVAPFQDYLLKRCNEGCGN